MNKLTNEEIATVFAMYLYCNFRYRYIDYEPGVWATGAKLLPERLVRVLNDKSVDGIELLLTPLSKITDEDLVACYHLHSGLIGYDYTCDFKPALEMARHWINMDGEKTLCKLTHLSEYLRSKGYAVPLFFGLNHWANGKTAIELGIAIENKTPNNYEKK